MEWITSYQFDKNEFSEIANHRFGKNWPVVYILENKKEAYIGETTNVYRRSTQHFQNEERKKLDYIHVIADEEFNKSATLDIESLLIEHIVADGKYALQNGNGGIANHNYYDREKYKTKFEYIWKELKEKEIALNDLIDVRNSDLFKYSPYKTLTEDQYFTAKSIYNSILKKEESIDLVIGEPGTGKTILAVYLMKLLVQNKKTKNLNIALVVPMTSLRKTMKKVFKTVKDLKASMVIGPNDVVKAKYDVLIVDEAHRLNQRKNITNLKAFDDINKKLSLDPKGNQLDWIKKSAHKIVLFYDGKQSIKPSDIEKENFEKINANHYFIESQMRVLGGNDYIKYIENILNEKQKEKKKFSEYEFLLFDNVDEMVCSINQKDKEFGLSRVVAGYAWEWKSKKNPEDFDINIESYKYRWNSTTKDWVNSENAINEIGCIHTVQGYDLNYAGVILGNEIGFDGKRIVISPEKYYDKNGKNTVRDNDVLKTYILNIYKILMTRGILGTYVYCCDKKLRKYLENFIDREGSTYLKNFVAENIAEYKK